MQNFEGTPNSIRSGDQYLLVGLLLAASAFAIFVLGILGCGADPLSPSQVTRLRILGLEPSPPEPSPGDALTLELLWTDVTPLCNSAQPCGVGQSCVDGKCVRDNDRVEMIWLVIPISAWQPSETGLSGLFGGTPGNDVDPTDEQCLEASTLLHSCLALNGCFPIPESPILICCGDSRASSINLTVPPEIPIFEPVCDADSSIDLTPTLQITVQVCVGGELDLCAADLDGLSFGCTGEGAESVTAVSRVRLTDDRAEANRAPRIEHPWWGRVPYPEDEPSDYEPAAWGEGVVVQGCQGTDCASRSCRDGDDCRENQICETDFCREVLSIELGGGAQETYLESCQSEVECEHTGQCEVGSICAEGICRLIENPITAFYATDGAFTPGRVVLDTTGDGRPNDTRFATRWLPPTLDPCREEGDPCSFGTCDPAYRLCLGEVRMWVVARDGRGGQDWIERLVRIVP